IISSDFKGAIDYLQNKKSAQERKLFQQVTYYRGVELYNENNFDLAIESFNKSLKIPLNKEIYVKTLYWKGEANYQLNNFKEALVNFNAFKANYEASKTEEFQHINYNIAYTYFKLNEYANATTAFKNYLNSNPSEENRINDTYLRIADGYFATRNYANAITFYNKAIENNGLELDYAQFQKAISYGLVGNENSKISELNNFLNTHTRSKYTDNVLYVLGNSYIKKGNNAAALETFTNLISNYNRSPLVVKAMLKKGLIYYNINQNNNALNVYKNVVSKYPNTAEARQAVQNARQIYLDIGEVDKYAAWVKNIDFVDVSNADLDNDMYEAAEKQFLQNNHTKAISAFKKYLQNFENGLHTTQANYYLAESLFSENRKNESAPYYNHIISKPQNEFTENALARLGLVYLENNNWNQAIPVLKRLEAEANKPNNVTFAQSNLMKGYYAQENYAQAVTYAEKVLSNSKIDAKIKADAQLIVARSALNNKNLAKARSAFKEVEKIATGEVKAEALYYAAFFENQDGSYRVSNQIVQNLAANYAPYKYWGARGLLIMANNYYELQDAFQATYILESVIQNFSEFPDIITKAKANLKTIKDEQAKTNESIKN
ncbi:MAG TPA: tetratricopeptide repeat protein, partial [Flavobacteriaceae bacterium]|nr:tetratricopeptide repeat protein [Flavobacteriaceae bacterium]